ncbi:uncharacterized protein LOC141727866 [Zonotrichia albicollis]|uniref:uncharacterized protein LOC141727866 n=1 Tax=Zonotrichia albicollis TaxID=44394 RepID=UPI003D8105E2
MKTQGNMYAAKCLGPSRDSCPVQEAGGMPGEGAGSVPQMGHSWKEPKMICERLFIKTEYNYINDEDLDPHIKTKQTPFSATKLSKLKKEFGRLPHESETEYVFCVSLTGGDQIKLTEQEASGYWGCGVFLTTGDKRDSWSLTQHAAYWARGINPLERGDPLAIATTSDQILESVQKAVCLQMIHERKLFPGFESPMQLPVKPEIMTPLIRGLPETLKSTAITIQKTIMALSPIDRLDRFLNNSTDQSDRKIWTWSEVAVDLINYHRQYGPLWPEAIVQHTNVLGTYPKGRYPSLATLVLHDSKVYHPNEWRCDQNELMRTVTDGNSCYLHELQLLPD